MVALPYTSQITPSTTTPEASSMSDVNTSGSVTPTAPKSDMDKILEAIQASTVANRMLSARFTQLEQDLAALKSARTVATEGATPLISAASPFTPQVLRAGTAPGVVARPGQTPMPATPTARGVSGFYVPVTPKPQKESATANAGIGLAELTSGDPAFSPLDANLTAEERIEASRRASDETSEEVRNLKSQLWSTCLAIVQKENRGAPLEEIVAKTDRMMAEHWLQVRKERIMRMFDPKVRDEVAKDTSKLPGKKEWTRKISQSAPTRGIHKLTHSNYMDWVSEIIGILAPIQGATEILEGIEYGPGYVDESSTEQTEGYDHRLDLEIGGLLAGSVAAECRGYVVTRQAKGEHRGSVLWRDLIGIMRRGDGVDKAVIMEEVMAEHQKSNEGVRPYAERLRTCYIKLSSINHPLSASDQVIYLLRGLQPRMHQYRVNIRGFQSQGIAYTFDSALLFLIQQETSAVLDRGSTHMHLLSRPTAHLASGAGPEPRRFHIIRNTANKGQPGYFNGECRHCHRWGHKQDDCAQRKREIDAMDVDPKPANARVAQVEDDAEQEDPLSDIEGEIYELMDEDGERYFARLATGPVDESEAKVASAMVAVASQAAVMEPREWTAADREEFAASHIPEKAIKWILDTGATHHMTSRSETIPVRIGAVPGTVVHIADGTKAKVARRGACVVSMFGDGGSEVKAFLKSVLIVPSFTSNLLSVQRLAEDGWTAKFNRAGAELVGPTGDKVQAFIEPGTGAAYLMLRSHPTRVIDIKGSSKRAGPAQATARIATNDDKRKEEAKLWHRRMAHTSYYVLRILASSPAFARQDRPGSKAFAEVIASEETCDPCIETKQPLLPFGDAGTEPPEKMSDVAFDLTGQFDGNKDYNYCFNILEAWSRMTWAFPIPNKEAATVFAVFSAWVELMENHGHGKVKRIHCDHGKEFENQLFQDWASKNGVQWCFSAPNTSQQNGLIERWNRTIQERGRAMLRAARLSDSFWPFAFRAACDIINKSPSSSIGNSIPLTLWTDEPVDYDTIRVFGCLCWVVKPVKTRKNKLSKQDHTGDPGDVVDLIVPRRTIKLSDVPVELDSAPTGDAILDMIDEEDEGDGDVTMDNAIGIEQAKGDEDGNWPSLDRLFGDDDDEEDLVTNEWTGRLNRFETVQQMPPSVYNMRNTYPHVDDLGSPISLGDLDNILRDTPTKTKIDPTVGAQLQPGPQNRRSKRIQDQFKALTANVELTLLGAVGEEMTQLTQEMVAQAFSAAIRSSADGVLIEPKTLAEAKTREDWPKWEEGMEAEIDSLKSMETWILTKLPPGRKPIGCRWTYKLKLDTEGKATRWKARLVAQGFSQKAGIDYDETFAPVARLTTVRILVALAIRHKMKIWSMDVVTAYLNGTITEDIYMSQPPHFDDGTGRVCKLRRSLYGLKQSGREWFSVVASWLEEQGFKSLKCEPCVFTKISDRGEPIVIVLYVDDVLIASQSQSAVDSIRDSFSERFKMTDNGPLTQVLGLKIDLNHTTGMATISQEAYVDGLMRRFGLDEANAVDSPMTAALQGLGKRIDGQATAAEITLFAYLIGCLLWIAQGTRPDISYAVSRLARFMANPRPEHIIGAKRLLRYLKGTKSIGLVYSHVHNAQIEGFCDADHSKDLDTRRSVSGYAFFIHGNLVSWRSRLQATVSISSAESEYVAMSEAAREAKWLRTFTTELNLAPRRATDIFTDSSGAYSLARNPEGHNRLKHIDVHHHFVRELVANQQVNVSQIGTAENAADIFTKVTTITRLHEGMSQLGLGDNRSASI
ncbi:hypothetical protein A4X13_0g3000 [Tilletia indica]|uniref:Uncharacterized protein n=1 Tax=Tilletia indica TaxID=43049 RepID=A0A177TLN0_9BASI|nr:hypothetical protein A4X13_0g3000 [Tilletia indica]